MRVARFPSRNGRLHKLERHLLVCEYGEGTSWGPFFMFTYNARDSDGNFSRRDCLYYGHLFDKFHWSYLMSHEMPNKCRPHDREPRMGRV